MGSPTVFTGSRTKFISSKGALLKDGSVIDNDGVPNFIKNGHAEINTTGWATFNEAVSGTTVAATNYVWVTFTDLVVGDAVSFPSVGTSGLSSSTIYYVIEKNTLTLKVSTTKGGSEFNITGDSNITIAKYRPLDGTGGTATSTWTRVTTNPLAGAGSFSFSKDAANRMGEGVSYAFTLDPAYRARVCNIQFDYRLISGTFAAGNSTDSDLIVYLYDVDNSRLIEPSSFKLLSNSSTISDTFQSSFQTSSNGVNYRLLIYCATASASAYAVAFDNVQVTPTEYAFGTPVTDWQSYTPIVTGLGSGGYTSTGKYRRVGDTIEMDISILKDGVAGSGSSAVEISIPPGLTIDTSKMSAGSGSLISSAWTTNAILTANNFVSFIAGAINKLRLLSENDIVLGSNIGINDQIVISAVAPILGWSSSVQTSDQTSTRVIAMKALTTGVPTGPLNGSSATIFGTVVFDTTNSYNATTGIYTVPVAGYYKVSSQVSVAGTEALDNYLLLTVYKGSAVEQSGLSRIQNTSLTSSAVSVTTIVNCVAGDQLSVRTSTNIGSAAFSSALDQHWLAIERISGPNQIAASETVGALYTGAPPTGTLSGSYNTVTFGNKVKDSHGSYNSGAYTIPVSGQWDISAELAISGTYSVGHAAAVAIYIDGVEKYIGAVRITTATTTSLFPKIDIKAVPLLAGQVLTIRSQTDGTSPSFVASAPLNFFSITRSGNY